MDLVNNVATEVPFADLIVGAGFICVGEVYEKTSATTAMHFPSLVSTDFTVQMVSRRKLTLNVDLP